MKYFIILFLFAVFVVGADASFAQYYGNVESHQFYISHEGQHEIRLQSSFLTQFSNVSYDKLAGSILITVDSDNNKEDIIVVSMSDSSFKTLLEDGKNIDPSDVLVLLDGEEQEYHAPRVIDGYVTWEFKNKPSVTEIEIIPKPERYRDTNDSRSAFDKVFQ